MKFFKTNFFKTVKGVLVPVFVLLVLVAFWYYIMIMRIGIERKTYIASIITEMEGRTVYDANRIVDVRSIEDITWAAIPKDKKVVIEYGNIKLYWFEEEFYTTEVNVELDPIWLRLVESKNEETEEIEYVLYYKHRGEGKWEKVIHMVYLE